MKKLIKILPVVMVVCMVLTSVFAVSADFDNINDGTASTQVSKLTNDVWASVVVVVRVLAVAAVVFAGLRYMFASADQKADIKKSMGILAIGAVLVFGATFVLELISDATSGMLNN